MAGCAGTTDLDAVQRFAQTTASVTSSFRSIAEDFKGSCMRRHEFDLRAAELKTSNVDLGPGYGDPVEGLSQGSSPSSGESGSDPRCTDAKAISLEWDRRNEIVLGYVQTLGAIAGIDSKPKFDTLDATLESSGLLTESQDSSFTALANTLSADVVAGDQRRLIASTVRSVEPSFRLAVASLKAIDAAYATLLHAEYNETFDFYNHEIDVEVRNASAAKTSAATTSLLMSDVYQQRVEYTAALVAINQRRSASIDYADVLDTIEATQEKLYDATLRGARLADFVKIANTTAIPLLADVEALRKATQ